MADNEAAAAIPSLENNSSEEEDEDDDEEAAAAKDEELLKVLLVQWSPTSPPTKLVAFVCCRCWRRTLAKCWVTFPVSVTASGAVESIQVNIR